MLSRQCRDMSVRDIVLERDNNHHLVTQPFIACGLAMEVEMKEGGPQQGVRGHRSIEEASETTVKIHVNVLSEIKRTTTIGVRARFLLHASS